MFGRFHSVNTKVLESATLIIIRHSLNSHLQDICVDLEFDKIHKEMLQHRKIVIRHGGVLGSFGQNQDKRKLEMVSC